MSGARSTRLPRRCGRRETSSTSPGVNRGPALASLAVAGYWLGLGLPGVGLLPLLWLGVLGLGTAWLSSPLRELPRSWWLLAYLSVTLFAVMLSVDPPHSLMLGLGLLPGVLVYVLLVGRCGRDHLPWLILAVGVGVALPGGLLLGQVALAPDVTPQDWLDRLDSPLLRVPNDALAGAVMAPLLLGLCWCGTGRWQRWLAGVSLLVYGAVAVALGSRGAVLLLAGAVLASLLRYRSRRVLVLGLLGGLSGLLLDALLGFGLLAKFGVLETLWKTRLSVWAVGWTMYLDHPLSGIGPYLFRELYPDYFFQLLSRDWVFPDSRHMAWAHNLFLEALVEQGPLGLLALLGLLGNGLWQGYRVFRQGRDALASGLLLAWCGFLLAGLYESSLARVWVANLLLFLLGLSQRLWQDAEAGVRSPAPGQEAGAIAGGR